MNDKNARSLAAQRRVLTVLGIVLGIVLAAIIGTLAGAAGSVDRVSQMEAEPTVPALPTESPAPAETLPMFTAPEITAVDMDFGTGPLIESGVGGIVNILLIGKDSAAETGARSDAIILCTFHKGKNTITMTSFLRDTYVRIPGYGKDRINAAYSYGGAELLDKTLYENFGVAVDGNICVDFAKFRDIIDLMGGITMELTAAEAKFIKKHVSGSEVTEGSNLLNGKEALMYARNRHDVDGDFSRTKRQRKLINAIIDTYKSKRLTQMLAIAYEILPMVSTDIPRADLTAYAVDLFPMLDDAEIKTQHIPISGGYYHDTINEKSVLVPYMEKNKQVLIETIG